MKKIKTSIEPDKLFDPVLMISILIFLLMFECHPTSGQDFSNYKVIQMNKAHLLIPAGYEINTQNITIVIHLHGKSQLVQDLFIKSKFPFPLITIHLGVFSSPYRIAFSDSNFLAAILNEAIRKIGNDKGVDLSSTKVNIILTSFSAGYGGIREILKNETYYQMISAIILLDGLHSDYAFESNRKIPNPEQMKDFLRFARDAVKFKKHFIITHSEIIPEGYSSTTETAQYLIDSTFTEKVFAERKWSDDFVQKYYAFNGYFRVFGFYGDKAKDHMQHLYNFHRFLELVK